MYDRPPIIEAVIELRFGKRFEFGSLEKVARKFIGEYPHQEIEQSITTKFEPGKLAEQAPPENTGMRLSSGDLTKLLLLRTEGIVVVQKAPYPGWEEFRKRAKREIEKAFRRLPNNPISRIGVRYVNRIDIPVSVVSYGNFAEVLNAVPTGPEIPGSMQTAYTVKVVRDLEGSKLKVNWISSTTDPLVPATWALILDIDIYQLTDIPQKEQELWERIDQIRPVKNRIFEDSITDLTREIMGNAWQKT